MQQTSSGVMSYDGKPAVKFFVFDMWNRASFFAEGTRVAEDKAYDYCEELATFYADHVVVNSYDMMLELEREYLQMGYEGVMLRRPDGPYKQNRSTLKEAYLVKVKRFHDAEAVVLDWEPLMRNYNEQERDERGYAKRPSLSANKEADDLIGALLVRCCESGQEFSIGSGFTEAQRIQLYGERHRLAGRILKYKSFKMTGVKDKPRHPIFLGFRDVEDM